MYFQTKYRNDVKNSNFKIILLKLNKFKNLIKKARIVYAEMSEYD